MFRDEILERFFAHKEMQKIPVGCQSTAVSAIEEVLDDVRRENPDVKLSELFGDSEAE